MNHLKAMKQVNKHRKEVCTYVFTSRKSASYARLRKVNDSLQLKVMGLSDQVENFRKVAAKHQQEYEKLEKGLRNCLM